MNYFGIKTMELEKFTQAILDSRNTFVFDGFPPLDIIEETEEHGGIYRAIIFNSMLVGMVLIDPRKECSVIVHPDYWRKGIATQALQKIFNIAFTQSGIDEIITKTEIGRPSSQLISKLGFNEKSRTESEITSILTKEIWQNINAE